MYDQLNIFTRLSEIAVGSRPPNDPFFNEGNKCIPHLRKYGIYETDDENFLHEPVQTFKCNIFGCKLFFDTVFQFEEHYNCCHRYTCIECKKMLPTPHLLDIHVSEAHDSYFAAQALKKPMFQCYVEECKILHQTPQLRKSHCIEFHSFPSSFRFDQPIKKPGKLGGKKKQEKKSTDFRCNTNVGAKTTEPQEQMEIESNKKGSQKNAKSLGSASHGQRQRILVNFAKDMAESLPVLTNDMVPVKCSKENKME